MHNSHTEYKLAARWLLLLSLSVCVGVAGTVAVAVEYQQLSINSRVSTVERRTCTWRRCCSFEFISIKIKTELT